LLYILALSEQQSSFCFL